MLFLSAPLANARFSIIKNGSFESDGTIDPITQQDKPAYWCDVNVPEEEFGAYVNGDWATHPHADGNSLTFYSIYNVTLDEGDTAFVSQPVFIEQVARYIVFDLELTGTSSPWNHAKRSAVILIDGQVVYDSNQCAPDGSGQCLDQYADINDFTDDQMHTLTLALRSNVTETFPSYNEYRARWDFVKFDLHCGGFGYLPEDVNRDCYVDIYDLELLADEWLTQADPQFDLFQDPCGVIDSRDFAVLANAWMHTSDALGWHFEEVNEPQLVLLNADLDDDGIVHYGDILVLAQDYLTYGDCIVADLNNDQSVDLLDFALLAQQWRQKGSLYEW